MKNLFQVLMLISTYFSCTGICLAQGYSNSYQQNNGFAGRQSQSNFNSGFSGLNSNQARSQPAQYYRQAPSQAHYQSGSTMSSLEQQLNAIDTQSGWARTPVQVASPIPQTHSNRSNLPAPGPGAGANAMSGMFPGVSRKEMMRVFIEGGTPQTGNGNNAFGRRANSAPANSSQNGANAYSNYQTAQNEETKSRNYANTARYDKDKWNRKNAASQAEYAANNANYAAQRAESQAYTGDAQARSYANLARQSANRARANADRARYNADTMP